MWSPLPPEPPAPGWWRLVEERELRAWAEGRAAQQLQTELRAERIERLRARCHEIDMRCAGALARASQSCNQPNRHGSFVEAVACRVRHR